MTLSLTAAPTLPDLNDPATFNTRALSLFSWMTGTFIGELEAIEASDYFSIQSSATDATAGRLLTTGASATVLSASPALRVTYGGTANAITLTTGASLSSLPTGLMLRFRATAANTGATTINVDGIGTVTAKTITGAALPSGYIRTDVDTVIRYDGTNWIVDRQIERGSNANGSYTKWADGTMICWGTVAPDFTSTSNQSFTFPVAFASTPRGMVGGISSGSATAIANEQTLQSSGPSSTTNFRATLDGTGTNGSGAEYQLGFNFMGRWF